MRRCNRRISGISAIRSPTRRRSGRERGERLFFRRDKRYGGCSPGREDNSVGAEEEDNCGRIKLSCGGEEEDNCDGDSIVRGGE